ncbi:MAG: porin family protein [Rickettsiales bacterium]|jgi:opacity protein-like surface antigen|nr:porin family protein [Rickettsiales bacterium]
MKKTLLSIIFGLLLAPAAHAGVLIDFYAGAFGGMGENITYIPAGTTLPSAKDLRKSGKSFGAVAGINIPLVRIEGEYDYISAKNLNLNAAMANVYVKLLPTPVVKPYIGIGAGMTFGGKIDTNVLDVKFEKSKALQGMLGLQVEIPLTSLAVDLEWRVLYAPKVYEIVGKEIGFLQSDIRAKIRYVF